MRVFTPAPASTTPTSAASPPPSSFHQIRATSYRPIVLLLHAVTLTIFSSSGRPSPPPSPAIPSSFALSHRASFSPDLGNPSRSTRALPLHGARPPAYASGEPPPEPPRPLSSSSMSATLFLRGSTISTTAIHPSSSMPHHLPPPSPPAKHLQPPSTSGRLTAPSSSSASIAAPSHSLSPPPINSDHHPHHLPPSPPFSLLGFRPSPFISSFPSPPAPPYLLPLPPPTP